MTWSEAEQIAMGEQVRLDLRRRCMPQVDALIMANWKFELPAMLDSEPWQWHWRRPPRRKGSKGRRFMSTQQAYNALMKENQRSGDGKVGCASE
jgi:hypothetical protein